MISLLLLPLLLLPSIQGQTCDMAGVEEMKVQMKEEMKVQGGAGPRAETGGQGLLP